MNNFRNVNNDILKDWFLFREDEIALLDTKINSMTSEINSLNTIEEVNNYIEDKNLNDDLIVSEESKDEDDIPFFLK